jgi:UDP-N-acetyl-2-amino-2-deoxyglucuronate dehydrogenase
VSSFALIGAGGYVAPRYMRAIQAVGGRLEAAVDPHDAVGIIDNYFPDAHFFTESERFDRHVAKVHRQGEPTDYISICSPNHSPMPTAGLRCGRLRTPSVKSRLRSIRGMWTASRKSSNRQAGAFLQFSNYVCTRRLWALQEEVKGAPVGQSFQVELVYVSPRGRWYDNSWKGDEAKSGGIATNIGVHVFDMLSFILGPATLNIAHLREARRAAGLLVCERAEIRWYMSIDRRDLIARLL